MQMLRWLPLVLCTPMAACNGGDERSEIAVADTLAAKEAAARTAALLAPVRGVSTAEIEFGGMAVQRATREDVRRYGQVVAADHRAVATALDSVAGTPDVTAAATPAARDLEDAVRMAHSGLETLAGAEFDLAFIRAEVESHRLLMDRLDQELIPGAQGIELRTLLQQVRVMTDAHLTRARQLLAELLGQPDPTPRRTIPRPRTDTVPRAPPPDTSARATRPDTLVRWPVPAPAAVPSAR